MNHSCPICGVPLTAVPRYPRYVCDTCAARATSADGRPLTFSNAGSSGGFEASYADNDTPYDSKACWIDGIACHADEARFGGIVIECSERSSAAADTADSDRTAVQR